MKDDIMAVLVSNTIDSSASALANCNEGLTQLRLLEQLLTIRSTNNSPDREVQPLLNLIQYGCREGTGRSTIETIRRVIAEKSVAVLKFS